MNNYEVLVDGCGGFCMSYVCVLNQPSGRTIFHSVYETVVVVASDLNVVL